MGIEAGCIHAHVCQVGVWKQCHVVAGCVCVCVCVRVLPVCCAVRSASTACVLVVSDTCELRQKVDAFCLCVLGHDLQHSAIFVTGLVCCLFCTLRSSQCVGVNMCVEKEASSLA